MAHIQKIHRLTTEIVYNKGLMRSKLSGIQGEPCTKNGRRILTFIILANTIKLSHSKKIHQK